MLGRAVQLSCPFQSPNEAQLRDSCTAEHYLNMCLHPLDDSDAVSLEDIRKANRHGQYLWGDCLKLSLDPSPDLLLMNLETALTTSIDNDDIPWEKGINYHFHSDNFAGVFEGYEDAFHNHEVEIHQKERSKNLSPVGITLANNHIIDFGRQAFEQETLPFLEKYAEQSRSIQFAGVGRNLQEASRPAHWTVPLQLQSSAFTAKDEVEVNVVAAGSMDSGVPYQWEATSSTSGVFLLPRLTSKEAVNEAIGSLKHWMTIHGIPNKHNERDKKKFTILSVHFGPNWAYRYSGDDQKHRRDFAHACIDECSFDMIYGHSSHHIRGLETYKGKLIVYGAGDLINDYEGFANAGDEKYCQHGALFLADVCLDTNELHRLTLIPTMMNRLQLQLLCPSNKPQQRIWNPRTGTNELRSHEDNANHLCNAINELTDIDVGSYSGVKLRVSTDPTVPDSQFVLTYP